MSPEGPAGFVLLECPHLHQEMEFCEFDLVCIACLFCVLVWFGFGLVLWLFCFVLIGFHVAQAGLN